MREVRYQLSSTLCGLGTSSLGQLCSEYQVRAVKPPGAAIGPVDEPFCERLCLGLRGFETSGLGLAGGQAW